MAVLHNIGTAFSHRGEFQDRPIKEDDSGTSGTESLVFSGLTELKSRVLQYPLRYDSNRYIYTDEE